MGGGAFYDYPQGCGQTRIITGKNTTNKMRIDNYNLQSACKKNDKNLIKNNKNAHITHSDSTRINTCAQGCSMQNTKDNIRINKNSSAQVLVWLVAIMMLFSGLFLGISYGVLKDSKTATGVISIVLPPTAGVGNSALYYDSANGKMYLGKSSSGTLLSSGSNETAKLILSNTQSANSAYIRLELNMLGSSALSYNSSGNKPMFSDSTFMNATANNGIITLVSNNAIAQYSYMFLDSVLSNLQVTDALINATLQIKASVSLEASFSNSSTNFLYYNLSTSSVVLPSGASYVATSITQSPEIGKPYTFQVEPNASCNKTAPVVKVDGTELTAVSGANGVYTFTIASLQGGESIVITPVVNTYTITIAPSGDSPNTNVVTKTLSHGDYVITSGYDLYYRMSSSSTKTSLYSGSTSTSTRNYTVSQYLLNDVPMATSSEFEVVSDMSITASWVFETISSCVTADTKISTGFNGEYKLAIDIKVGDYVLGMDMKTGKLILSQVTNTFIKQNNKIYTVTFDDGSQIKLTGNHPMLTTRGWVCTNYDEFVYNPHIMGNDTVETTSLKVGDKVKSQYSYKTVVSIKCSLNTESVYDFTVTELGNFFADGTLLHNGKSPI